MANQDGLTHFQVLALRWALLQAAHGLADCDVTETMCLDVVRAAYPSVGAARVRSELAYLEDLALVKLTRSEIMPWKAVITAQGRDVVEYVAEAPAGIARPPLAAAGR